MYVIAGVVLLICTCLYFTIDEMSIRWKWIAYTGRTEMTQIQPSPQVVEATDYHLFMLVALVGLIVIAIIAIVMRRQRNEFRYIPMFHLQRMGMVANRTFYVNHDRTLVIINSTEGINLTEVRLTNQRVINFRKHPSYRRFFREVDGLHPAY